VPAVRQHQAYVSSKGRLWKVPEAFCGERLAIRPCGPDGQYGVFFGAYPIANIDLTQTKCVGDVSEQVSVMSPG
jgi:putative transposase